MNAKRKSSAFVKTSADKRNSKQGNQPYKPQEIEQKWQAVWEKEKIYSPNLGAAKKPFGKAQGKPFYNLMMFPYPSAEGMHVGNMYAFTGADVYGRFQRMQGKDVFEPIGLDGFGIHSENYAIKMDTHPVEQAKISEKNFYRQLKSIGNSFDWMRTVETYKPEFYKWTQWLFIQLFKAGLAYRKKAPVNFCPSCKTVLSDEQVIDGLCERCNSVVEKRDLEQWFFKITKYADRLLNGLSQIDWSEKVKTAQKQWIGKSEGARIRFKINDLRFKNQEVEVFTTRPDTLFGATFLVLSPEYPLVASILNEDIEAPRPGLAKLKSYVEEAKKKTERERGEEKEKTGIFTDLYAINPVNNEKIPVWIADYVLMGYGTGAIMAVPAHDKRDWEFAKKYNLPVIQVIKKGNIVPRSYLMGGKNISDKELQSLDVKILGKTEKGDRKLEIPSEKLEDYISLVKKKMNNGFWNEIVGDEILFIFKNKNGQIKEIILNKKTSSEIEKLGAEYNDEPYLGETSTWKWLAENDTYTDIIIHDEPGIIINSDEWDGLNVPQDMGIVMEWLEKKGLGKKEANYHLRDWLISRQRYWGPPIPMIYCQNCETEGKSWFNTFSKQQEKVSSIKYQVLSKDGILNTKYLIHNTGMAGWYPEENLPVELPYIEDYKPLGIHSTSSGQAAQAPLASHPEFYKTKCPKCGGEARRETDVSDTFLDSAWYFFRYVSTDIDNTAFDIKMVKKWLPVNMYIGGAEHSVLHLLYSRFMTMALHDLGLISFEEPFTQFRAHGLIVKDGAKMSKSKGNVVVPDAYIKKFGADALRTYLMFMGPFSQGGDFRDSGIEGMFKFLNRVWNLIVSKEILKEGEIDIYLQKLTEEITEEIKNLRYNTAISRLMMYYNFLIKKNAEGREIFKSEIINFIKMIAPFAPHLAEEIWELLGQKFSVHFQTWPKIDKNDLEGLYGFTIAIQINGKTRATVNLETDLSKEEAERRSRVVVEKYLKDKKVTRVIYIERKVVNFVAV